jgi:hypothetical protein
MSTPSDKKPQKKPYQKPSLNRLGHLTQLTAGGSGMMAENLGMGMGAMGATRFP